MTMRAILLFAGLVIAVWLVFFRDGEPADGIIKTVARSSVPAADRPIGGATAQAVKTERAPVILALRERETLVDGPTVTTPLEGLFASQSWAPSLPPPPRQAPPPPPTAPLLPFTYLGKKNEDGDWEVYLARGEQTYIVRAQSTIDDTYRVESIAPPTMSIIYLPLHQMQTLYIGGAD